MMVEFNVGNRDIVTVSLQLSLSGPLWKWITGLTGLSFWWDPEQALWIGLMVSC